MKRFLVVLLLLAILSMLALADDIRFVRDDVPYKQFVGPNGIYMMLSQYNRNFTHQIIQSFESELAVFTPDFKDKIRVLSSAMVSIFVVRENKIEQIINSGTVPKIPEDGYLVVGHGRASEGFMGQFEVGDEVFIRDYTPKYQPSDHPEALFLADDSIILIDGWNRGRRANEVIAYNSDYADKTYNNQYGNEIAVVKEEIVYIRPYEDMEFTIIPSDGFVVATHGAKNVLINTLFEGDFIELE